jgi:hypothetical protein
MQCSWYHSLVRPLQYNEKQQEWQQSANRSACSWAAALGTGCCARLGASVWHMQACRTGNSNAWSFSGDSACPLRLCTRYVSAVWGKLLLQQMLARAKAAYLVGRRELVVSTPAKSPTSPTLVAMAILPAEAQFSGHAHLCRNSATTANSHLASGGTRAAPNPWPMMLAKGGSWG